MWQPLGKPNLSLGLLARVSSPGVTPSGRLAAIARRPAGDVEQGDAAIRALDDEAAVDEAHALDRRLQQVR
jgi:hypothetical protein